MALSQSVVILYSAFCIPVDLLVIFLNPIIITVICKDRQLRKQPSSIYIANLALVDIIFSGNNFLNLLLHDFQVMQTFFLCVTLHAYFPMCLITASILFMFINSVDRFIFIKMSMKYHSIMNSRMAKKVALCIWIYSFVYPMFPFLIFDHLWNYDSCHAFFTGDSYKYGHLPMIVMYLLTIVLTIYMFVSVFRVVRKSRRLRHLPSRISSVDSQSTVLSSPSTPPMSSLPVIPELVPYHYDKEPIPILEESSSCTASDKCDTSSSLIQESGYGSKNKDVQSPAESATSMHVQRSFQSKRTQSFSPDFSCNVSMNSENQTDHAVCNNSDCVSRHSLSRIRISQTEIQHTVPPLFTNNHTAARMEEIFYPTDFNNETLIAPRENVCHHEYLADGNDFAASPIPNKFLDPAFFADLIRELERKQISFEEQECPLYRPTTQILNDTVSLNVCCGLCHVKTFRANATESQEAKGKEWNEKGSAKCEDLSQLRAYDTSLANRETYHGDFARRNATRKTENWEVVSSSVGAKESRHWINIYSSSEGEGRNALAQRNIVSFHCGEAKCLDNPLQPCPLSNDTLNVNSTSVHPKVFGKVGANGGQTPTSDEAIYHKLSRDTQTQNLQILTKNSWNTPNNTYTASSTFGGNRIANKTLNNAAPFQTQRVPSLKQTNSSTGAQKTPPMRKLTRPLSNSSVGSSIPFGSQAYSGRDIRTLKILFIMFCVYIILWMPNFVIKTLRYFITDSVSFEMFVIGYTIGVSNSVFNFFVYPMRVPKLRTSLKQLFQSTLTDFKKTIARFCHRSKLT